MKFEKYINEAKPMKDIMIGFPIKETSIKRIRSYIKSFFIRNNITYEKVTDPHFTVVQITGTYEKDDIIREMNSLPSELTFNPKGVRVFKSPRFKKDFWVLEYKPNNDFVKIFKELSEKYEIRKFGEIKPHVSILTTPIEQVSPIMFNDIEKSMPPLPKIKTKTLGLWNKNFSLDYLRK